MHVIEHKRMGLMFLFHVNVLIRFDLKDLLFLFYAFGFRIDYCLFLVFKFEVRFIFKVLVGDMWLCAVVIVVVQDIKNSKNMLIT